MKRFLSTQTFLITLFLIFQGGEVFSQSEPPVVTAVGDQIYCPQTQQNIVTDFDVVDPDSSTATGFYIQISTGFVLGQDQLILTGSHSNINSSWNPTEAKLSLTPASGASIDYDDIINAVNDVVFFSNNINVGPKTFSLTIGEANFLNGHYYEFIESQTIPWTASEALAEGMEYYGLQGYLATITNPDEARICGELSPGTGWIGGSDAQTEGVWKWVTGPEAGTVFWNGNENGTAPTGQYSNWNSGEPNDSGGNEDYVHITDQSVGPPGSWNDLPNNTSSQPPQYTATGFVVEYGGMPGDPELNISASTSFSPPEILSITPATTCENETVTLQATSNTTDVLWYDSQNGGTLLFTGNSYTPTLTSTTTLWVLASNEGCETGLRTPVTATVIPNEITDFTQIGPFCVGETIPSLPTTSTNGINGTWSPASMDNTTTTLYTFSPNGGACIETANMTVTVLQETTPTFQINDICIGETIGTLPSISNEGISGSWTPAPNNLVTTTYTFTPDVGECSTTTTETVQVNPVNNLVISTENISEPFDTNQVIEVSVSGGSGNYEYQLDGGNWQNSAIFQNVVGCENHIIKVKDAEGCSNDPETTFTILDYPKFFTPNGDGYNDLWNIRCLQTQAGIISIFNRHGKLLNQFKTNFPGWNGTYNGKLLPASDYWFIVTYYDENGKEKQFKSHFSLIH
ncbi:MAG: T9SS type B sorting domain-containing protein [Flavobacteriaceae bacterium]